MISKNKIILLIMAAVLLLAGCSTSADILDTDTEDLMSLVKAASWPEAPNTIDSRFQKSLLDFSWNLFQESSQNDQNVLISPASVYLALGMTYNGADTETRQAIIETLSAAGLSEEEFNAACRDYISILQTMGDKTELSVANAIWYRQGFNPDKSFLQKNADYFAAEAKALDFSKLESLEIINNWVKDETRGTIDKIIDEIDPAVVMYLMNAVYFKSDWQEPFDAADTVESQFHGINGPITAKFMNRTGEMDYINKDGINGIMLPYDDGRFRFFALLPEEGTDARTFISQMDGDAINSFLQSIKKGYVGLALPKFETRFEDSLKDELAHMGMEVAFDPDNADFSKMNQEREKNLYISEILHKTFCRVDELGTEASAVTSVEIRFTSMPAQPDIQISFDRPFVYGIVDIVTGAPLFLGLMENPME